MNESLEILDILLHAVHEVSDGTEYLVKCHPDYYSSAEIVDAFGHDKWPKEFRIWNGNLADAFGKAKMIIVSNSSSMVEAAVLGIPVILVGRQSNLNMNRLAEIPSASFMTCYDGLQLGQEIAQLRNLSQHERDALIRKGLMLRDELFTPVDDNGLKQFVV